jgi:hypothetical protein
LSAASSSAKPTGNVSSAAGCRKFDFEHASVWRVKSFVIQSREIVSAAFSLILAAAIWIPSLQFFFRPPSVDRPASISKDRISSDAKALAAHQLRFWRDPTLKTAELKRMRRSNAEWDFMSRTFLALALCEMCEGDPTLKPEYLPIVDQIIDETVALEKEKGMHFFLMSYSTANPYRVQPPRSLFLDSEIAAMLAARRMVEEKGAYKTLLAERLRPMETRLQSNSLMAMESYPDECWMFDHAIALAAFRMSDFLDGTDHTLFFRTWGEVARQRLTHPQSGLLVSEYTMTGKWIDGPEGSSLWAAIHFIRLFDPELAEEQYKLARQQLARSLLGFGWSREWPLTWRNHLDIDSGAVIPLVDAGAAASGLALIASASMRDTDYHNALRTSLNFAAFPTRKDSTLRYAASNAVGDAALLYAYTLGPLWEKIIRKPPPTHS